MANKHYTFPDEEIEITIKVKVKNIKLSTYYSQSYDDNQNSLDDFKNEIIQHLKDKIIGLHQQQEVTECDLWSFELE